MKRVAFFIIFLASVCVTLATTPTTLQQGHVDIRSTFFADTNSTYRLQRIVQDGVGRVYLEIDPWSSYVTKWWYGDDAVSFVFDGLHTRFHGRQQVPALNSVMQAHWSWLDNKSCQTGLATIDSEGNVPISLDSNLRWTVQRYMGVSPICTLTKGTRVLQVNVLQVDLSGNPM